MSIKISIIIPTYNRAGVINETLDSILEQTYTNWECLIVDDGSSDHTDLLIEEYKKKDKRFKYIKRPFERKKGGNTCRNIGLEHAQGEYIQFVDSDDLISPNKLETQLRALEESGEFDAIATCKWEFLKNSYVPLKNKEYRPTYFNTGNPAKLFKVYAQHGTFLPHHVFLVRKHIITRAGGWHEDLITNQDGEFFTRVILSSSNIVFVPEATVYYRTGGSSNIHSLKSEEWIRGLILSWELIDDTISRTLGIQNHPIVEAGRTLIYNKAVKGHPEIIKEYKAFFKMRRSRLKHLSIKVISRIQLLYFEKLETIFKKKVLNSLNKN